MNEALAQVDNTQQGRVDLQSRFGEYHESKDAKQFTRKEREARGDKRRGKYDKSSLIFRAGW